MNLTIGRIAWRNLWRHPQRTLLMIATVAVGSLVILVLFGLSDGVIGTMTATQVDWDQGDFQIRSFAYAEDPLPENALTPEQTAVVLEAIDSLQVAGITPRMEVAGMVQSAYGTDGVIIRGIDLSAEILVTNPDQLVVEGKYLDGPGQILLSVSLASDLDVRIGERAVVIGIGADGTESRAFTLVGTFQSPITGMENMALAPIDDARSLASVNGVTSLAVALPKGASVSDAVEDARALLTTHESIQVADYFDLNPFAKFMIAGSTIKMIPFVLMISLMAGFGVANTAFYSVLERTREFGVMTAVGMSRRLLSRMVLAESIIVAGIGFVLGGGLGYWGLLYLNRTGWDISGLTSIGVPIALPQVVYASTSGWYWLAALSVVGFTALVAAWYPARRVNQLEPVSAIREG